MQPDRARSCSASRDSASLEAGSADQQAILDLLQGAVQIVRFQPGPDLGGKAADFKPGDAVWLSLDCPVVNPFTGQRAVAAEAIVLSVPTPIGSPHSRSSSEAVAHGETAQAGRRPVADGADYRAAGQSLIHIVMVRSRLMGAVPAARLRHRFPGEFMPGRKLIEGRCR